MRVNDPDTFIGNRGYHLEEEAMLRILAPRVAGGVVGEWRPDAVKAWLNHARCVRRHRCMSSAAKLRSWSLTPFEFKGSTRVPAGGLSYLIVCGPS